MAAARSLIAACVHNPVLANMLTVCMLVGGALCAQRMARETYPEFSLDRVQIDVDYPGAGPEEIERSICIEIEQAIQGVPGIRRIDSHAVDNRAQFFVELLDTVKDPAPVVQDIQDRIEQITTFPEEAKRPVVQEMVYRTQVILVTVSGDIPVRTLYETAREIHDELLDLPGISLVQLSGVPDSEITIEISESALQRYNLSLRDVAAVVAQNTMDLPAGSLRTRDEEITLRTVGQRYTAREFEDLVLIARPDGTLVRLGQVASVSDGFAETERGGRFDGTTAAGVRVLKTPEEDASLIARQVRAYVERKQADLPDTIKLSAWADASKEIDDRINMVVRNGLQGIVLVVICLTLLLDLRVSLFVALGVPVSYAGALAVMYFRGETLNMVTLFALIMLSGIVVDDAIVIAERYTIRRGRGDPPVTAAIEGTRDVFLAVLGSAVTTMIAFAPLYFVRGVMGKLIAILPVVVIVALTASLVEAFGALPSHLVHAGGTRRADRSLHARFRARIDGAMAWFVNRVYRPVYHRALAARGLTVCSGLAIFVLVVGLVTGGRIPFTLFPEIDGNMIRAQVQFPEGTSSQVTLSTVRRMEQAAAALNDDPDLKPAAGGNLLRHTYSMLGEMTRLIAVSGGHQAEVTVELMPAEQRKVPADAVIDRWRERIGPVPGATSLVFSRVQSGPADKPVDIRLLGPDLNRLEQAADELATRLADLNGVRDIEVEPRRGKRELQIALKPAARTLGLTLDDLARQVRSGFYGGEAVRVQRGKDDVTVRVRYPEAERASIGDIEHMHVRTPAGDDIPFLEVADLRMVRGYSLISRQQGERRCRVMANVDEHTANAERIVGLLEAKFLPDLVERYGITYSVRGQHAQMIESIESLVNGFIMALILIWAVLAGMLRSYVQPVVIMAAIPLGFVGAVVGHWLMGYELTLFSLFGVVALAGVVVNDSLVLLDQVNKQVSQGTPVGDAVRQAGPDRFRAVILTTVTTVAGLAPLLSERSTQAQSLIPMAISLAFGLMAATLLTLVYVPALYLVVNDARRVIRWLRRGGAFPSAESVEPQYAVAAGSDSA
jgi:multidrug efflux pump subunit AcrB